MNFEERIAIAIREAGERIREAHEGVARAEAELKRGIARAMAASGEKSTAAQARHADDDDGIFQLRCDVGAAEGELAASRANLKAIELRFEAWRTNMANQRTERRTAYGDR